MGNIYKNKNYFMRKLLFPIVILVVLVALMLRKAPADDDRTPEANAEICPSVELYHAMNLEGVVDFEAFHRAVLGYQKIDGRKRNILTLIDFNKPSTEERLYVFDLDRREVLFISHVAHGRNSGENYATSFSNQSGSHKSSLGFYLTGITYQGGNGYSMRLHGLEKGINDRAYDRAIVVHAAAYANPSVIGPGGRLGRSFGCPALPEAVNDKIINRIKGGTVMYIHADDKNYVAHSEFVPGDANDRESGG